MKPDWKNAPEWANYLAMDTDSSWWWFEKQPYWDNGEWDEPSMTGRILSASRETVIPNASLTMEKRP